MALDFEDLVIDKRAVMADPSALLEEWKWLDPILGEPMLPTACGDVFLRRPDDGIAFLDTYVGTCDCVAPSYEHWKAMLSDPQQFEMWFRAELVAELMAAGLCRTPGQCFSPLVPQVINGSWEPSNFHACELLIHLAILGQLHRQTKDLPAGTRISGFRVVEE